MKPFLYDMGRNRSSLDLRRRRAAHSSGLWFGVAAPSGTNRLLYFKSATVTSASANPPIRTRAGTLRDAIAKIKSLPVKASVYDPTGDITHLSKDEEFDNAEQIIKDAGLQVFYVPGEHDVIDEDRGKAYLARYGKNAKGAGWQSFDYNGVHYIGLVNVMDLKAGGLGNLGAERALMARKGCCRVYRAAHRS